MARERFENRKLTGVLRLKLERDDHDCGKYWEADKATVIDSIVDVVDGYAEQGYKLTLRQVYYQLVARNVIPNDNVAYKKLSALLDDCRYSGVVDWNHIEDRGRIPHTPYYEHSISGALQRTVSSYALDKRKGQDNYVELWTEKDAISNILKEAVFDYTITVGVNKGFISSTALHKAYERFIQLILNEDKRVIVLYLGDHDPSGLDMIRDINARLEFMMANGQYQNDIFSMYSNYTDVLFEKLSKHDDLYEKYRILYDKNKKAGGDGIDSIKVAELCCRAIIREKFKVVHIGITKEHINEFNLPPNPAKLTDPRAKAYVKKHGDVSWEVDALQPTQLIDIVKMALGDYVDIDVLDKVKKQELYDVNKIREIIKSIDE